MIIRQTVDIRKSGAIVVNNFGTLEVTRAKGVVGETLGEDMTIRDGAGQQVWSYSTEDKRAFILSPGRYTVIQTKGSYRWTKTVQVTKGGTVKVMLPATGIDTSPAAP